MVKIKTLKTWNKDHTKRVPIAPRTHVKAVFDDNGSTLDSLLGVQDEKLSELGSEVGVNVQTISFTGTTSGLVTLKKTFEEGEIIFVRLVSCDIDDTFVAGFSLSNNGSTSEYIGNIREVGGYIKIAVPSKANQIICSLNGGTGSAIIEVSTYKLTQNVKKIEKDLENTDNDISELNKKLTFEIDNQNTENIRIESTIDTLGFKVSPISITTEVVAGTDINNTIYGNFKKGSVLYLKADWDSNISTRESIAIVADYSETAIITIQKHVLTKLIIPQDTSYLRASMYRSFVTGDGDITFSIVDKLFIDSKDAYYPLQNGQLDISSAIIPNSKRKTTGLILNNSPLYIQVDDAYNVAYMYGNDASKLSDGGYIIERGVNNNAIVDVDAKYIGFTIVKETAFNEDDDCKLIICKSDSVTETIVKYINNLQSSVDELSRSNSVKLVNGATWTDGLIHEVSGRRTTGIIKIDKPIKISLPKGYNASVNVGANLTGLTDLSYVINDGGEYIVSGYNYMAVNIVINANNYQIDFPSDNNIGLIIADVDSFTSELVERTNPIDAIKNQLILEQFNNTTTISDSKELIAVSDAFDINDLGLYCAGMTAAENAVGEYGSASWKGYLLMANLADIEKTKTQVLCYPHGVIEGLGWIESVQHGMAKWTGEDEITTIFKVIYRPYIGNSIDDNLQYSSFVTRKFIPSTKEWQLPVIMDINVMGNTYEMTTKWDISDGRKQLQSSIDDIIEIWAATGIEHPSRWESEEYSYNFGNNFFKYNNEWYAVICLGAMSHALCKSSDLVHWTFVCDIPLGQISLEEAVVCIYKDKVYAMSRGENQSAEQGGDGQDSKIMYCSFSSLSQSVQDWSEPVILKGCHRERPTIAALNNKLYIMQGTGESAYTENKGIARGVKILIVMDLDLNVLKWNRLNFTYPMLHPQFMTYGGNLMMSVSSDKRCFGWTMGGDTRSEISVGHLNEHILGL